MSSVSHTKRRKQVAASLASRRKRGDLTPPAVVASRDEPTVLRTRSQRLPGLSTAESDRESDPFFQAARSDYVRVGSVRVRITRLRCRLESRRKTTNGLRQKAALFSKALLHTTHGDISAASQAEIRGGSRPGLPDTAGVRSHPSRPAICQRLSSPAGETVLMGNWLAKVVSTFSWLAAHGVCVHRHTLRVKFT